MNRYYNPVRTVEGPGCLSQLPQVLGPLLENLEAPPVAVGASVSPTTAEGSYMPCFLVGKNTAGLLGQAWKAPVEHFSHQQGHIAAALYSAGRLELLERRFLAFHVSGGTTEALLVQPDGEGMPHITLAAHHGCHFLHLFNRKRRSRQRLRG